MFYFQGEREEFKEEFLSPEKVTWEEGGFTERLNYSLGKKEEREEDEGYVHYLSERNVPSEGGTKKTKPV